MKQGKLIRRAVSAVLAGCMMFTLLPVVAFAALGTFTIGSNSYETETDIPEQELGGGTINYDAGTHTLTLNGVNIEDFSHDWVIDFNDMDTLLNLVLVGKNILKGHGGISAPKLKISGTGSLQITATNFDGIAGAGQSEENLTIGSDVDITAMEGCAIVFNGSVRIENGATVKAKCLYGGIDCHDLTIDSATEVNLESTGERYNAICAHRDNDGTVAGTANIKNSKLVLKSAYPAFYAADEIEINGGSVEAASTSDAGIFTGGKLSITDADIDAAGYYFGIGSNGAMEMTGGKLKAVGQKNGVSIRNSLTLNNVEVDAQCEELDAISSKGPMVLNGGKIEAVSKNASGKEAYAIYAGNRYDGDDGDAELLAEGSLTIKGNAKVHVSGCQGIGSDGQTTIGEADIEIDSTDFSIKYPVQIENGNKILSLKGGKDRESATVLDPDDFVWDRLDPNCIGKNAYLHIITGSVADPDEPLDPDFSVDDGSCAAGAIVAGTLIGGAAVWGGYEITTRVILNDLLPEGAAIPANRGELAMLLWQTAGKPEPAAQPAFADVADAELAKAAQWCVEQGLLDAKDGKFDPDGWMPKFKTIEVWKKAFPNQ